MRCMVLVKASKDSEAGVMPSEKLLAAMGKYNEELMKAGVMLAGEGLRPSSKGARVKFSGDQRTVTDGPFSETKELVAGFWIWQVKSIDEAVEWLKRAPFDGGNEVEIRPIFGLEDFGPALTTASSSSTSSFGRLVLAVTAVVFLLRTLVLFFAGASEIADDAGAFGAASAGEAHGANRNHSTPRPSTWRSAIVDSKSARCQATPNFVILEQLSDREEDLLGGTGSLEPVADVARFGQPLEQLDDRPEGDAFAVGQAAAANDGRLFRDAVEELPHEP